MQKALKMELIASNLPEVRIVAHVASAKMDGRPYALVGLAMGAASGGPELEGVLLHWACVSGQNQDWQQPPAGWHTDPDYSQGAGKAWQTPLGRYAPQRAESAAEGAAWALVLQLPLEGLLTNGGGVQFVVKRGQGSQPEWLQGPDHQDFFIPLDQAANIAKQSQHNTDSPHEAIQPPAPKRQALSPAGMDKHAKKALWDQRKAERARVRAQKEGSGVQQAAFVAVGSSEDWIVLDTGKSYAWSAQQTGTLQQQADALEKLIQQQGQQENNKAAEGLALAATALESAKPLLQEAKEAQKAVQVAQSDLDGISR
ncbi:COP9 signalosome complex subunit 8 [Trebouxia sp. C0009 RCD-2024]